MKSLKIESKQGTVTIVNINGKLEYEIPMGMAGSDFRKFKKDNEQEIEEFEDEGDRFAPA